MNEPENFLARWSRLKRETVSEKESEPPTPPFDPKSLPSIELIDATTDIRPFLNAGVPEELTRAALRNTWSADPAIRDFVGIAENQWDFSDPNSIPGFGAVTAADYVGHLLVQSVKNLETPTASQPEQAAMTGDPASECFSPPSCEPADGTSLIDAEVPALLVRPHGGALPK